MTTMVNGNELAQKIGARVVGKIQNLQRAPRLDIFVVGEDSVTASFVRRKKQMAQEFGIEFVHHAFTNTVSTNELVQAIDEISTVTDAIVIQLPLPSTIEQDTVLATIPIQKDVDVLSRDAVRAFQEDTLAFVPPVAGAVVEILTAHDVTVSNDTKIVVIGKGKLVGAPVATLLTRQGGNVTILDSATPKEVFAEELAVADIVISGTGIPGLVQPEMVKKGVVLIDAGTSSSVGAVVGDIAAGCKEKASLFSSTPGGIGPVTVAVLLENVVTANTQEKWV